MMKARENKLEVAEMLMLRYICGVTRNERMSGTTKLRELSQKCQESEVVWTCEGEERSIAQLTGRRVMEMEVQRRRKIGRPKRSLE